MKVTGNGKQKELIFNTLEHITNVTNVGLRLSEVDNDLVISFPVPTIWDSRIDKAAAESPKAELIFSHAPDNDLKISQILPVGEGPSNHEELIAVPSEDIHEKIIYESVINFLKRVEKR